MGDSQPGDDVSGVVISGRPWPPWKAGAGPESDRPDTPNSTLAKVVSPKATAEKALVDGYAFTRGAERTLSYMFDGRIPNDEVAIQTTVRLLRAGNRHLAVALEYGEAS